MAIRVSLKYKSNLEAFTVYNRRSRFVVFLLRDPHLLEGGKRSKNGSTNPDRVFTFWRSDDLDFHRRWSKVSDFLLHSVSNSSKHSGTSREHHISVKVLPDVDITLHDRVVTGFVDSRRFHADERRLEESFRAPKSLVTDGNNLAVWKFIRLLQGAGACRGFHFLIKVQGNVRQLFL